MRGWDVVTVFGDVVGFDFGQTDINKDEACTISVVEKKRSGFTNVRVNIYGDKVENCKRNLRVGCSILVKGELMSRKCQKVNDKVLEVRGHEIEFVRR